jgi:hypothetical protein
MVSQLRRTGAGRRDGPIGSTEAGARPHGEGPSPQGDGPGTRRLVSLYFFIFA